MYGGYGGYGATMTRDHTRSLFSQTMGYVAVTAALFAAGAYLGRDLSYGLGWVWFIAAFVCLIAMNFTVRRSQGVTVALLSGFGVLIGLAMAPVLAYYAGTDPSVLWSAGGATALFIAGFGAAGYATRRDLTALGADLIYSIIGLVIFAGFTMFDFQRLRTSKDIRSAPLLAASIFLDILNVFLFFLRIFSRD
jgi:FtsH-binding integral membrane protein